MSRAGTEPRHRAPAQPLSQQVMSLKRSNTPSSHPTGPRLEPWCLPRAFPRGAALSQHSIGVSVQDLPAQGGLNIQRDHSHGARNRREGIAGTYMAMSAASRE